MQPLRALLKFFAHATQLFEKMTLQLIVQSAPVSFEDTPEENLSAFQRFLLAEKSRAFPRVREGEDCFTGRPRPQPEVQLEPEGKSNSAEGADGQTLEENKVVASKKKSKRKGAPAAKNDGSAKRAKMALFADRVRGNKIGGDAKYRIQGRMNPSIKKLGDAPVLPMEDANEYFREGKESELADRYARDGYVLIRGAIDAADAKEARRVFLNEFNQCVDDDVDLETSAMKDREIKDLCLNISEKDGCFEELGADAATASSQIREGICCNKGLQKVLSSLCSGMNDASSVLMLKRSAWLRLYANSYAEAANAPHVYYSRGDHNRSQLIPKKMKKRSSKKGSPSKPASTCADCGSKFGAANAAAATIDDCQFCSACTPRPQLCTCFVSLNECSANTGALCVLKASHLLPGFGSGVGMLPTGFATHAKGMEWRVAEMGPGDVLVMHSKLVRGMLMVTKDVARMSVDFLACFKPKGSQKFGTTPTTRAIAEMENF